VISLNVPISNAPNNRAILSVNLLMNNIDTNQAKALVLILKEHPTLKSLCGNSGDETELHMSGKMYGAGDAIMLVADIAGNGALSKLIFGGVEYWSGNQYATPEPAILELGMTEADLSNKHLQAAGAIIIAAWISHRDKGALVKLDIGNNYIGAGKKRGLQRICVARGIDLAISADRPLAYGHAVRAVSSSGSDISGSDSSDESDEQESQASSGGESEGGRGSPTDPEPAAFLRPCSSSWVAPR
jgi:hypothetical protein